MPSTPAATSSGACASAVEVLLAGLLAEVEAGLVQGLESDFERPSVEPVREPDARAERLAAGRAKRAAAARADLEGRFTPGTDSSRMWALALGVVDPAEIADPVPAPALLDELARLDREVDRAHGRRYAALAAIAGTRGSGAVSSEADRHIAHEVAIALHMSKDAAARHIATARSLFEELAPFGHALLEGSVSD